MKIGIESQRIFRKGKHGMDVVAVELIRQLQTIDSNNEYLLFAKKGDDSDCVKDTTHFKTVLLNGISYPYWEQVALPAAVRKHKPDLLHCTANTAPLSCAVPLIVTIHDIIYLEETNFKGSAYQNLGNLYRKFVVPHAIKKATKLITVSEYEKEVITRVCNVDPGKVVVIHNGVDKRFHGNIPTEDFKKQYDLPEQFILFLGNTAPKKNTEGVGKAYEQYCSMTDKPLPIVITDYKKSFLDKMVEPRWRKNFILPGYIPSSQMPLLYNCCEIFLYPSLRESFGLPVLEAMACGIPVITSDIPAIREVAGDAAKFIDPTNPAMLAEAIHSLLNNAHEKIALTQKGLARASQFSWESAARKLVNVYTTSIASP